MRIQTKKLGLAAVALLASVAFTAGAVFANPYAKHKGKTLVVSWPALSHYKKAQKLVQEFTAETGIKVEVDFSQYLKMRDRQILEMSKAKGDFDVVSWVVMWKGEYVSKGLLTPLSQFFASPALVDPDYDLDDIADAYLQNGGVVGGKKGYLPGKSGALYGIPFGAETSILAYRKDIFKELGLPVPKTYDDVVSAAKIIKKKKGIGGLTMRGKTGHQVTAAWLFHGAPMGARVFDDKWNPTFNNAAGVKAAQFLRDMVKLGPPGIATYGFGEMSRAFLHGDAAMYIDSLKIAAMARDPKLSKVSGKIGFALHPTDARCGSETGGFAMGIPGNAKNKEAAFLFIQWMTTKRADRRMVELGGDPIRISTLKDPQFSKKFPEYPVIAEQLKCADPDWRPLIPEWNELNIKVLGLALTEVITTEKPIKPIMDKAAAKARAVMEREGYYQWANLKK